MVKYMYITKYWTKAKELINNLQFLTLKCDEVMTIDISHGF
jgi:hypothetical protein